MKLGKHQSSKQRWQYLCWKVHDRAQSFVLRSYTMHELRNQHVSTPERAVRVKTLAGDIALCSWARHFTLTVPLSTQAYKWVPANCWRNLTNCWEVTCDGLASRPGEVEILLAASCYRNRDKHRQLWASLGSKASLHFLPRYHVDTSRIAQLCLKRPQLQ